MGVYGNTGDPTIDSSSKSGDKARDYPTGGGTQWKKVEKRHFILGHYRGASLPNHEKLEG